VSRIYPALLVLVGIALPPGLAAQGAGGFYSGVGALSGGEARGFSFDPGYGTTKSLSQWRVPVVVVVPVTGPLSLDLTANYADERLETYQGNVQTLSGFTDTQLRLLYTLSPDRLVGSISFNLPTGQGSVPTSQFGVAGAIASNYLSFPVPNAGTAFGVTSGLAYAQHTGSWNVGFSGSVRYLASYQPFSDTSLSYTPGIEGRVRAGADRLVGERSRLLAGFTVSTFSSDTYSGSSYSPGTRFIADATFLRVIGRCTLTLAAWDLYRLAESGNGASIPATQENVLNGEARLTWPVGSRVQLEPMLAYRQWNPADSTGSYLGGHSESGGLTVRVTLADRVSLNALGRYDAGWIFDAASGSTGRANFTGYQGSLFVRVGQ